LFSKSTTSILISDNNTLLTDTRAQTSNLSNYIMLLNGCSLVEQGLTSHSTQFRSLLNSAQTNQ